MFITLFGSDCMCHKLIGVGSAKTLIEQSDHHIPRNSIHVIFNRHVKLRNLCVDMLEEKSKVNVLDSTVSFKAVWMKVKHVKKSPR